MILGTKRFMLKSELANKMSISPSTLLRFLKRYESEIIILDPNYSKKGTLLSPKIISFLIDKFGFTWEEILK